MSREEASESDAAPLARAPAGTTGAGVAFGVAAYLWWGLAPIYFKLVAHVPALQVLAHRIVWSVLLLGLLLAASGTWREVARAARTPRVLALLTSTTLLVGANWYIFIWAVANDQVRQASLGYFINPLISAALGVIVLRERPSAPQALSFLIAGAGVVFLTTAGDEPPWVALSLAISFGLYGLLRKIAQVGSLAGLSIETALLAPVAAAYLLLQGSRGESAFGQGHWPTDVLLLLAGIVTATPLLWFASATRRLRLATLGVLQYIAPSLQFVLAIAVYREPLSAPSIFAFACIWTGLLLYTTDALRRRPRGPEPAPAPAASAVPYAGPDR